MLELDVENRGVPEFSEESLIEYVRTLKTGEIKNVVLLGDVRSGKTTKLLKIIGRVSLAGLRVGGICQPESGGVYYARDVETAEDLWIARRENDSVSFNPDAFDWAARKIVQARKNCDVLAVDEMGRLESVGDGHIRAVLRPLDDEKIRLRLLTVREKMFNGVRRFLPSLDGIVRVGE